MPRSSTGSATFGSPQTTRASSSPSATRKSSPASSRASLGRRTLWSSEIPSSQTGYQIRSAVAETSLQSPVDEHHVEIAVGAELPTAVPADRHDGHPPAVTAGCLAEEVGQPLVGGIGVGPAELLAVEVGSVDQRLSLRTHGHWRTVPSPRLGPGRRAGSPTCRHIDGSGDYPGGVAQQESSGLRLFDAVLLVGAGAIAIVVVIFVITSVLSIVWFLIKAAIVVAVIAALGMFLLRRRR